MGTNNLDIPADLPPVDVCKDEFTGVQHACQLKQSAPISSEDPLSDSSDTSNFEFDSQSKKIKPWMRAEREWLRHKRRAFCKQEVLMRQPDASATTSPGLAALVGAEADDEI